MVPGNFFGVIIGGLLIFIDSNYNLFRLAGEKKPELYNGAVQEKTDEMYLPKQNIPK